MIPCSVFRGAARGPNHQILNLGGTSTPKTSYEIVPGLLERHDPVRYFKGAGRCSNHDILTKWYEQWPRVSNKPEDPQSRTHRNLTRDRAQFAGNWAWRRAVFLRSRHAAQIIEY